MGKYRTQETHIYDKPEIDTSILIYVKAMCIVSHDCVVL